jgi:trehalose utilization protein
MTSMDSMDRRSFLRLGSAGVAAAVGAVAAHGSETDPAPHRALDRTEEPMNDAIRVTVWNEGLHESLCDGIPKLLPAEMADRAAEIVARMKKNYAKAREIYPDGIGGQIAKSLQAHKDIASVRVQEIRDEQQGLTDETLNNTDVLLWWGHLAHDEITDENVDRVHARVLDGMGLLVLHSAHMSRIFRRLMGTGCMLKANFREERERLWITDPAHSIAQGLPEYFDVEGTEMYGEPFEIPQPDQLVFISWFEGGEVFRSGCCWHRQNGRVFYFRPGHETSPIYYDENVLRVIYNGIRWATPPAAL